MMLKDKEKEIYNRALLDMMVKLHKVCEENNIKYTLLAGSLLGAVRHKGFIPWDDDLDIGVPRADYERLCQILESDPIKGCFLQNYYTEKHYNQPYSKLRLDGTLYIEGFSKDLDIHQGLFIDIFPLDKISAIDSKSARVRKALIRLCTFAIWSKEKCRMKHEGWKKLEYVVSAVIGLLPKKTLIGLQKSFADREKKDWGYYASMYSSNYPPSRICFKTSDFDRLIMLPFEDISVCAVEDWDSHLKRLFKNYMQYPPEDKRNSGHDVIKIDLGILKEGERSIE